jgi:hypothetical protein
MNSFSSLELIRSHGWTRSFFTTYALSLSFFEAVVLDALVRQGVEQTLIMADVAGVAAALSEEGVRSAGRAYQVEPVAVSHGCFHAKLVVLTSQAESHLLIGSGNLTFGGWGSNLECVEHLHPGVSAEALNDAAEFLELLAHADTVRHDAAVQCTELAGILRKFSSTGARTGLVRIVHNLARPIFQQLGEMAADLGGAERLTIVSPFYDGGAAANRLCGEMGLDRVYVHAHHAGIVPGSFGSNWPKTIGASIEPVAVEPFSMDSRHLHAKAFEVVCRKGRIVLSGSANSTMAALDQNRNVELCVARIERDRSTAWSCSQSSAPVEVGALNNDTDLTQPVSVLRAAFAAGLVRGEVLTKFSSGAAKAGIQTGLRPVALGETNVSNRGCFELLAPSIELEFWKTQRLILRLESTSGEVAQGFVAFPAYGYIAQRAGAMKSRFFALLTSTDTPEDVAAIISYFLDNPADRHPERTGGGKIPAPESGDEAILVSDLIAPGPGGGRESASQGHGDSGKAWRRFLEDIFACFRQSRAPIESEKESGSDEEPEGDNAGSTDTEPTPADNAGWPIHLLEKLLDAMLADPTPADCGRAFWMTHYVCDRIAPDTERIKNCLDRLLLGFEANRPVGRDLEAATGAVLVRACASLDDASSKSVAIRRRLLRLGGDPSKSAPDISLIPGFVRVLAPDIDVPAIWEKVQSVTTIQEEIRAFRIAGKPVPLDQRFPRLRELPELKNVSERRRSRVVVIPRFTNVCPYCHVFIPKGEESKLRQSGVVIHERCGRIILSEDL